MQPATPAKTAETVTTLVPAQTTHFPPAVDRKRTAEEEHALLLASSDGASWD